MDITDEAIRDVERVSELYTEGIIDSDGLQPEKLIICINCGHEVYWRTDAGKPRWAHKDTCLAICNSESRSKIVPCAEPREI